MDKNINTLLNSSIYSFVFKSIKQLEQSTPARAYLIGGAVRDLLLGVPATRLHDLDFVIFNMDYTSFAKELAKLINSHTIQFKDNVRIPVKGRYIDISKPRGLTLDKDRAKRDFTVNNLALSSMGELFGDNNDILNGIIRPVYEDVFKDDPLRILRGFRQASMLKFKLGNDFIKLAVCHKNEINNVAFERVNEELIKLCATDYNKEIFHLMNETGIWGVIFDFEPENTDFICLNRCVDLTRDIDERYAMFLAYAAGKDITKLEHIAEKLLISNNTQNFAKSFQYTARCADILTNAKECGYTEQFTQSAVKQILSTDLSFDTKKYVWHNFKNIDILMCFAVTSNYLTKSEADLFTYASSIMDKHKADSLNGNDIIDICPERIPGKWMKDLLTDVKIKLAFNELADKEQALDYIKNKIYGPEAL